MLRIITICCILLMTVGNSISYSKTSVIENSPTLDSHYPKYALSAGIAKTTDKSAKNSVTSPAKKDNESAKTVNKNAFKTIILNRVTEG